MISQKPPSPDRVAISNGTDHHKQSIDSQQIAPPRLTLTETAKRELQLILKNDHTLLNKVLRIQISGKECHGFNYACGFTSLYADDFILKWHLGTQTLKVALDPFTAFYLKNGEVDFIMNLEKNIEGFTVTNLHQNEYTGKFWQNDQSKIPPLATTPHKKTVNMDKKLDNIKC